jgi:copper chaperone
MLKSITLEVIGNPGITCQGCEQRIERMLKALPGVERVRAKASSQQIDVLYDASRQDAASLASHLAAAGYRIRPS